MPDSDSQKLGCLLQGLEFLMKLVDLFAKLGAMAALWFIVGFTYWTMKDEQFLTPPFGEREKAVSNLSECVGWLNRSKSEAEGLCRIAQIALDRVPRTDVELDGRRKYVEAKKDFDDFIGSVSTAMLRQFEERDVAALDKKKTSADAALAKFKTWCESLTPPKESAKKGEEGRKTYDSLGSEAADHVADLKRIRSEQNSRIVEGLLKLLAGCRWRDWDQLSPAPPVDRERMKEAAPTSPPPTSSSVSQQSLDVVPTRYVTPNALRRPGATPGPIFDDYPELPTIVTPIPGPCPPN